MQQEKNTAENTPRIILDLKNILLWWVGQTPSFHIKYAVESDLSWKEIVPEQSQKLNSECIFNVTIFKTLGRAGTCNSDLGCWR